MSGGVGSETPVVVLSAVGHVRVKIGGSASSATLALLLGLHGEVANEEATAMLHQLISFVQRDKAPATQRVSRQMWPQNLKRVFVFWFTLHNYRDGTPWLHVGQEILRAAGCHKTVMPRWGGWVGRMVGATCWVTELLGSTRPSHNYFTWCHSGGPGQHNGLAAETKCHIACVDLFGMWAWAVPCSVKRASCCVGVLSRAFVNPTYHRGGQVALSYTLQCLLIKV